jgi:hypothetical protein
MTTSTLTVTEFVLARIAEDEAAALRRAQDREAEPYWRVDPAVQPPSRDGRGVTGYLKAESPEDRRVLAQCAAMRKIVVNALVYREKADSEVVESRKFIAQIMAETAEDSLQPLASIWSDHPDWREEWA